ncbi:unnamed protein product [Symbiodinium sp. CCMP2592]|nr:unnamed protein product [Symbiodinium sp. CCMP2592]
MPVCTCLGSYEPELDCGVLGGEGLDSRGGFNENFKHVRLFDDQADPSKLHVFEWSDLDEEADALNKRRLNGEEVPAKELDALISERKKVRLKEGLELFDDWLLRHARSLKEGRRLEVVLEAHVPAREVELHEEPSCGPAPIPHSCIRSIEQDSDEDSEDERDPDDGQGTYLDYLRRRCLESIPSLMHAMDPRELGDDDHEDLRDAFQALLTKPLPPDPELTELEKTDAKAAQEEAVAGVPSRKACLSWSSIGTSIGM